LPHDGLLSWSGLALFAAGMVLQIASMRALGSAFTVRLGVRAGHKLVIGGPYRRVRHPAYLSYLMSLTGIALAMGSLVGLGIVALIVPFIVWRVRNEEAMLLTEFEEEYAAYMSKTRRLVPMVW
jgi:protein-S-isoprenylcysteine O-methyltransferase Ste14